MSCQTFHAPTKAFFNLQVLVIVGLKTSIVRRRIVGGSRFEKIRVACWQIQKLSHQIPSTFQPYWLGSCSHNCAPLQPPMSNRFMTKGIGALNPNPWPKVESDPPHPPNTTINDLPIQSSANPLLYQPFHWSCSRCELLLADLSSSLLQFCFTPFCRYLHASACMHPLTCLLVHPLLAVIVPLLLHPHMTTHAPPRCTYTYSHSNLYRHFKSNMPTLHHCPIV